MKSLRLALASTAVAALFLSPILPMMLHAQQPPAPVVASTRGPPVVSSGTITPNDCAKFTTSTPTQTVVVDSGSACGTGGGTPGGTSGQIQFNNSSAFGGFTASGDATINTATGAVAVTKTAGVAFTGAATMPFTSPASWTPTDGSGAGLVFTGVSANWQRIGNMVFAYATITYPGTANGTNASLSGFPVTAPNAGYAQQCSISYTNASTLAHMQMIQNTAGATFYVAAGTGILNSSLSGLTINFMCIYPAT